MRGSENRTCFVAGTMVLTASGLVAIENIKAGDKIVSVDHETGEKKEKVVKETYIRKVTELVHLTIGGEEIITTHDHPFYVLNRGFKKAGQLTRFDKLIDSDGCSHIIQNIAFTSEESPTIVYNFQAEDFHTYFVGLSCVLVHNADYGKRYTPEQQKLVKEGKEISKKNQVTRSEAEDYYNRCKEAGFGDDKVRIDSGHMDRMNPNVPAQGVAGGPYLHVPAGDHSHVPIIDANTNS